MPGSNMLEEESEIWGYGDEMDDLLRANGGVERIKIWEQTCRVLHLPMSAIECEPSIFSECPISP